MSSVLLQKHRDKVRPVGYFSAKLDQVAAGLLLCLRAISAAEKAVACSRDIVGYQRYSGLLRPAGTENITPLNKKMVEV